MVVLRVTRLSRDILFQFVDNSCSPPKELLCEELKAFCQLVSHQQVTACGSHDVTKKFSQVATCVLEDDNLQDKWRRNLPRNLPLIVYNRRISCSGLVWILRAVSGLICLKNSCRCWISIFYFFLFFWHK